MLLLVIFGFTPLKPAQIATQKLVPLAVAAFTAAHNPIHHDRCTPLVLIA
jgi:hypothetical protein